jgi:hypothetical protein
MTKSESQRSQIVGPAIAERDWMARLMETGHGVSDNVLLIRASLVGATLAQQSDTSPVDG